MNKLHVRFKSSSSHLLPPQYTNFTLSILFQYAELQVWALVGWTFVRWITVGCTSDEPSVSADLSSLNINWPTFSRLNSSRPGFSRLNCSGLNFSRLCFSRLNFSALNLRRMTSVGGSSTAVRWSPAAGWLSVDWPPPRAPNFSTLVSSRVNFPPAELVNSVGW